MQRWGERNEMCSSLREGLGRKSCGGKSYFKSLLILLVLSFLKTSERAFQGGRRLVPAESWKEANG